jgi:Fe-Mn family superoxide dismutase
MTPDSPLGAPLSRRDALKLLGTGVAAIGLGALPSAKGEKVGEPPPLSGQAQPFVLPQLGYSYASLEPNIDAQTMEIHYTKHHQAYITNANKALADHPALTGMTAEEIVRKLPMIPEPLRTTLRNNVGGHVNHSFFWKVIGPSGGGVPKGALGSAIAQNFGSFEKFRAQFTDAAMKRFGSGWAWLVWTKDQKLAVVSTANQDSPITDGSIPIIGLDVWEHAYYLKYQNRRADYLSAYWSVVDWSQAAVNLTVARPA